MTGNIASRFGIPFLFLDPEYLGTVGWWLCYARVHERPAARRLVLAAALVVGLATVAAGAALGFDGQYGHFRQHNPGLLERLEKALPFC